jgi:hypothetical protein
MASKEQELSQACSESRTARRASSTARIASKLWSPAGGGDPQKYGYPPCRPRRRHAIVRAPKPEGPPGDGARGRRPRNVSSTSYVEEDGSS